MLNIPLNKDFINEKNMVNNLLKKGYSVDFYARNPKKTADVEKAGAVYHSSIKEALRDSDVIITMVGGPLDVEDLYFKENGIFDSVKKGSYLIDMTSSSPSLAIRLYNEAQKRSLHSLDAPVTGGDVGARDGTLSVMVGGSEDDLNKVRDVLYAMAKTVTFLGSAGAGQHCKLVNQIMCAGCYAGMCEGLAYAKKKGLDLKQVIDAVSGGAAGSRALDMFGGRILVGDMMPGGQLSYLVKDLKNVENELSKGDLKLNMSKAVLDVYQAMIDKGDGGLGVQAMYAYLLHQDHCLAQK